MHTTKIDAFTFTHNGDFSGNVEIRRTSWERSVFVPACDLRAFVAEMVRAEKLRAVEQATPAELLGLTR